MLYETHKPQSIRFNGTQATIVVGGVTYRADAGSKSLSKLICSMDALGVAQPEVKIIMNDDWRPSRAFHRLMNISDDDLLCMQATINHDACELSKGKAWTVDGPFGSAFCAASNKRHAIWLFSRKLLPIIRHCQPTAIKVENGKVVDLNLSAHSKTAIWKRRMDLFREVDGNATESILTGEAVRSSQTDLQRRLSLYNQYMARTYLCALMDTKLYISFHDPKVTAIHMTNTKLRSENKSSVMKVLFRLLDHPAINPVPLSAIPRWSDGRQHRRWLIRERRLL